ncbi:MAG: hypothetical protein ACE5HZ_05720 [Fidelibacterota bacterium]
MKLRTFFSSYRNVLLLWAGIMALAIVLLLLGVDKKVIALLTLVLGLATKAFAGLAAIIALIPVVGPILVKIFALPFFWIVNGLGYLVSMIAIKKGYTKDVVRSRVLTVALLVGILLGYILGHLLPIR